MAGGAFAALLVASLGAADLWISRSLKARFVAELTRSLHSQGAVAAAALAPRGLGRGGAAELGAKAEAFARACGCRVTLIRGDGTVAADSEVPQAALDRVENHAERPEVRSALSGQPGSAVRRSATVGRDFLYAAVPLKEEDPGAGVVRAAADLRDVEGRVAELRRTVALATVLVGLGSIVLLVFVSRALSRPIEDLEGVAERLARGEYSARVHALSGSSEHRRLAETMNQLASQVETTIGELSSEKARLAAILANMVEAVIAVDADGRIIEINPALRRLFGLDDVVVRGRPYLEILRHAPLAALMTRILEPGAPPQVEEIQLASGLGEERTFEAHGVPMGRSGEGAGALLVLHDITRLRRLELMRRDFVANVSHELRTPLASIRAFTETLLNGGIEDAENRREFVQTIDQDAERMARLVEELLDLSAIESGRRAPELEPVSLEQLARSAAASLKPSADRQGVRIEVETTEAPKVAADPRQISQVLANLLDNAVKYARRGGRVKVSVEHDADSVTLVVADDGLGIPAEDLPRIFERFYRVDKARSRGEGGSGLGLSIVRHLVEAHGGRVWAESREGEGSTFRVRLARR